MLSYKITIPAFSRTPIKRLKKLSDEQQDQLEEFNRMLVVENVSEKTRKTYILDVQRLFLFVNDKYHSEINLTSVIAFFSKYQNLSSSRKNQIKAGLIKFLHECQGYEVKYLRKMKIIREKPLPKIFTVEEVQRIIQATENIKYKLIFMFAYGCGLRLNEILSLKYCDINKYDMKVFVKQGKGAKQRYVNLPQKILQSLIQFCRESNYQLDSDEYIFQNKQGRKLNGKSAQDQMHLSKKRAGVEREGCVHTLRHSFATHCLNQGITIDAVSQILGHSSLNMTMVYTKTANRNINVDLLNF